MKNKNDINTIVIALQIASLYLWRRRREEPNNTKAVLKWTKLIDDFETMIRRLKDAVKKCN